ncbi:hypothetical protein WA158_006305 [Blastocystis sp. Blastoise]
MRTTLLILFFVAIAFAKSYKVFHMTDIHMEEKYTVGAPASCAQKPCCRPDSVQNGTRVAGKWGDDNCDNSPAFIEESMRWFRHYFDTNPSEKPDWIMVTGDEAIHGSKSRQSQEINLHASKSVFGLVKEIFNDYIIVPTFGNHDTYPEGHMLTPPNNTWMTYPMAEFWDSWVPSEQVENVKKGGYYTKLVADKWRVIVLNCLWEYTTNTEVEPLEDPADQNAFLKQWLEYSRQNNETVWVLAHIPTGSSVFNKYNIMYSELMAEYKDVVRATFSGHTHVDEFYVVRDVHNEEKTPLSVNFVTAALEGYGGNNPGAKLYTYDDETKDITNFVSWEGDFNRMNKENKFYWTPYFNALDAMKLKDLSPVSVIEWANRMFDDDELFQDYMTHYHVGRYERGSCKDSCKINAICKILFNEKDAKKACVESRGNFMVEPDLAIEN